MSRSGLIEVPKIDKVESIVEEDGIPAQPQPNYDNWMRSDSRGELLGSFQEELPFRNVRRLYGSGRR